MAKIKVATPHLFGKKMRKSLTTPDGLLVWKRRFGGLIAIVVYDASQLKTPWHWRIDAWSRVDAISGDTKTYEAAEHQLEKLLNQISQRVAEISEDQW